MGMVDMKLTPKEVKEERAEAKAYDPPPYPWGLCIRLEKEELDKLKLASLPNVGDEFHIVAIGRVTSVSSSLRDQKDDEKTVSIQLVALNMSGAPDDAAAPAPKKAKPASGSTLLGKY